MQDFDGDYISRLNSTYKAGKFLKAVQVTESPEVVKYWVDHEKPITFEGHVWESLPMRWDGIKTSQSMPIEGATISISNLGNQAVRYIKTVDISGSEIILKLLHLDLLSTLTHYWTRRYKILSIRADVHAATFTCGRVLGRNKLPRNLYLKDRYRGLSDDIARIF